MVIQEWLSNPSSYQEGLSLYEMHGNSANLKRILAKGGDTPRNRETLIYELSKLTVKVELATVVHQVPDEHIVFIPEDIQESLNLAASEAQSAIAAAQPNPSVPEEEKKKFNVLKFLRLS